MKVDNIMIYNTKLSWTFIPFIIFIIWIKGFFEYFTVLIVMILHEFSHIIMAKHFEREVNKISILPIGVCANIEYKPFETRENVLIYAAGPCFNIAMAIISNYIISIF